MSQSVLQSAGAVAHQKFKVIYADPPWQFRVWDRATGSGRSAESYYRTMPLSEMVKLPVADYADKDCALIMWAVMPNLPEAFTLGAALGFKYKTCAFSWAKQTKRTRPSKEPPKYHIGMGYYTRANVEIALLFTRGNPKRLSKAVRQLIVAPVREHSQKPDEAYGRIEALFEGPYLEMFARQRRTGWSAMGDEIDADVIMRPYGT